MGKLTESEVKNVGVVVFCIGLLAFLTYYAYKGLVDVDVVVYFYVAILGFIGGMYGLAMDPRINNVVKSIVMLAIDIAKNKISLDEALVRIKILIQTLVEIYNEIWNRNKNVAPVPPVSSTPTTVTEKPPA